MADHVRAKRSAGTAEFYRDILNRIVKPAVGTTKADKLTRLQVSKLHCSLSDTPFQTNRVLAVIGSMYAFADRAGQSSARDRQVQGKPPRAIPDRRGTGTAGQSDPRSGDHRHPVDGERIQGVRQARALSSIITTKRIVRRCLCDPFRVGPGTCFQWDRDFAAKRTPT